MSQKSDDSIERFFRKAVVQQDKTFMERDWHSMEEMLDARAVALAAQHAGNLRGVVKTAALVIVVASLFITGAETKTDPGSVQMQGAVVTVRPQVEVKTENPTADLHPSGIVCDEPKPEKIAVTAIAAANLTPAKVRSTSISKQEIASVSGESLGRSYENIEKVFAGMRNRNNT
jgi:hypothetical protein